MVNISHFCIYSFSQPHLFQAGIPGERLKIVLEAEVASIYCQHMRGVGKLPIHSPGCTYVVADIGGGWGRGFHFTHTAPIANRYTKSLYAHKPF